MVKTITNYIIYYDWLEEQLKDKMKKLYDSTVHKKIGEEQLDLPAV